MICSRGVTLVPVIMFLLVTRAATSKELVVYFIIPDYFTEDCPGWPCTTLSDYASQNHSTSMESVLLFFLVGPHTLGDRGLTVKNIASFTMMGDTADLPKLYSRITCSSRSGSVVGFNFYNVTRVQISSLVFHGCGHDTHSSVLFYIDSVPLLNVTSCVFKDNGYTSALFLKSSSAYISSTTFTNNTALFNGSALRTYDSRVEIIGSNCFTDNVALGRCGAVDAERSVVVFNSSSWGALPYSYKADSRCMPGATTIVNNTAVKVSKGDTRNNCCGGAVCIHSNSELTVYGTSWWAGNGMFPPPDQYLSPPYWGGALFVEYSSVNFDGYHTFIGNTAGVGGAIYMRYSTFSTTGQFIMENNSAFLAGAMYISRTFYHGEGSIVFNGNFGKDVNGTILTRGGSVFVVQSFVYFNGSVTVSNSFAHVGGGKVLSYSSATFRTSTVTANRGIIRIGGGSQEYPGQELLLILSVGAAFAVFGSITIYLIFRTVKGPQVTRNFLQA